MLFRLDPELAGKCLPRDGDAEEDILRGGATAGRQPSRQLGEVQVAPHGLEQTAASDEILGRSEIRGII